MDKPDQNLTDNQEIVIDLQHYVSAVMRFKWQILLLSILVTSVTSLVVFSLQPIYRASTTVLIDNQNSTVMSSIDNIYSSNITNQEYYLTQHEILKSRDLAEKTVIRMGLMENPIFDLRKQMSGGGLVSFFLKESDSVPIEPTYQGLLEYAATKLQQGTTISPIRNTQLVNINFESIDPNLAAKITDRIANEYIKSYIENRNNATKDASSWLVNRLDELRSKLKQSEAELQSYREEAKLIDVSGVLTLDAEEISQLTISYSRAKDELLETKSIYDQIQRLSSSATPDEFFSVPAILNHPLIFRFKEAEAESNQRVAELSKRYGPKHPRLKAAISEASSAKRQLYEQIEKLKMSITTAYYTAVDKKKFLEKQLQVSKVRLQDLNRKEFKLRELQQEVDTNRQLYEMFLTKAKQTQETQGLEAPNARIVDPAIVPKSPIKPRKILMISSSLFLSLIFGAVVALILDSLNNTIRTPEDIETKLKSTTLGFLPLVKENKNESVYEGFLEDSNSSFSESIRTIRTSLILSSMDDTKKITVITSTVANEGKSSLALNLSEALGQMEKVLLIDADLRRPSIGSAIGLAKNAPGLSNLVAGTATLKQCLTKLHDTSVYVIPAGIIPPNPLEVISSKRFLNAINQLSNHFDRIIIDSAPTHSVSDSMVLATYAGSIVYVVKADSTAAPLAAKGIKKLKSVNAPIIGIVLNQVDIERASGYSSYYSEYYKNYSYPPDLGNIDLSSKPVSNTA